MPSGVRNGRRSPRSGHRVLSPAISRWEQVDENASVPTGTAESVVPTGLSRCWRRLPTDESMGYEHVVRSADGPIITLAELKF